MTTTESTTEEEAVFLPPSSVRIIRGQTADVEALSIMRCGMVEKNEDIGGARPNLRISWHENASDIRRFYLFFFQQDCVHGRVMGGLKSGEYSGRVRQVWGGGATLDCTYRCCYPSLSCKQGTLSSRFENITKFVFSSFHALLSKE